MTSYIDHCEIKAEGNPNEIVHESNTVKLIYGFGTENPLYRSLYTENPEGFTRSEIFRLIRERIPKDAPRIRGLGFLEGGPWMFRVITD